MPGDTLPIPLTERLVIALNQLRAARLCGDPAHELAWQEYFDGLLDAYPRQVTG